jgi:hypothetical protein
VKNHHIWGFFTIKVTYLVKNAKMLKFGKLLSHQKDRNVKIWGFLNILVNYLVKNHHIWGFFTIKVTYLVKNA